MKIRAAVLILFISTQALRSGAQGVSGPLLEDGSKFDSTTVIELINNAGSRDLADSSAIYLESAIRIAEKIKFTKGSDLAYHSLISYFQNRKLVASEVRTRLQFGKFLKSQKRFVQCAQNNFEIGKIFFRNQLYEKAEESFLESFLQSKLIDPANAYPVEKNLALACKMQGVTGNSKKFGQADSLFNDALSIAQEKKFTKDQLWIYQQLAEMAHLRGQFDKEFDLSKKVLSLALGSGTEEDRFVALNNLGYAAKYSNRIAEGMTYFEDALSKVNEKEQPALFARILTSIAILNQSQQKFKPAISGLEKASAIFKLHNMPAEEARTYDYLALIYYQQENEYLALFYSQKAIGIGEQYHLTEALKNSYHTTSMVYQSMNEFEESLEYFKLYLSEKNILDSIQMTSRNEIMQQQFVLEKLEKEMKLFYVGEELKDVENAKLMAENEAKEERNKTLEKENKLKDSELTNKTLKEKEARNALRILQQQSQVERQNSEIEGLNKDKKIKDFELNEQKATAREAERLRNIAEQEKKIKELEVAAGNVKLKSEKERVRNLFFLIGGLVLLIFVIAFVLVKLRSKNKKIARQNIVIEKEREKSESLLLNILPASIADELKENGFARPRQYESVSVLFTDFAGFTKIAEKLSPAVLVQTLDKIFLEFDLISERNGLSRIKTIGDAYMAVCGLPEPNSNHAAASVKAALEMRDFISGFNKGLASGEPAWQVRIGISTGPVVAGVVGVKKFAYDIWGDTVNTASRMESSGEAGRVNISGNTFELLKGNFNCEYRGKVSAKNKGEIDMYFVNG